MAVTKQKITRNKLGYITQIQFTLDTGTNITAEPCYESWQQWGGTREELWETVPLLEKYNPQFYRDQAEPLQNLEIYN